MDTVLLVLTGEVLPRMISGTEMVDTKGHETWSSERNEKIRLTAPGTEKDRS